MNVFISESIAKTDLSAFGALSSNMRELENFLDAERKVLIAGGLSVEFSNFIIEDALDNLRRFNGSGSLTYDDAMVVLGSVQYRICEIADKMFHEKDSRRTGDFWRSRVRSIVRMTGGASIVAINWTSMATLGQFWAGVSSSAGVGLILAEIA